MNGTKFTLTALFAVALFAATVSAQQKPAAPAPAAPAAAGQAPAARPRLAPPVRGEAELGYIKPVSKRSKDGKTIVTTMKVKNLMTGSIAGLKIEEFWYDKGGNPVSGDTYRNRKPLQPDEVIEITLNTPVTPSMVQSQFKFEHANGAIKPKMVPKL